MDYVVFRKEHGIPVICGINEALDYAYDNKKDVLMVRSWSMLLNFEENMKGKEKDLLKFPTTVCSLCNKNSLQHTFSSNGDRCTRCDPISFLEESKSLRGCGFMNSPWEGAYFE